MTRPELPAGLDWPEHTLRWWNAWVDDPRTDGCTETDWLYLMDGAILHAAVWGSGDFHKVNDLRLHMKAFEQRLAELSADVEDDPVEGTPLDDVRKQRAANWEPGSYVPFDPASVHN